MKKGIWLDKKQAFIFDHQGNKLAHLDSEAETRVRFDGEKSQSGRFGAQFIDHSHKDEHRLEHQLNRYYHEITDELAGATEVMISGPAQTKNELAKVVAADHRFKGLEISIKNADSMTENQKAALVREFYATPKV